MVCEWVSISALFWLTVRLTGSLTQSVPLFVCPVGRNRTDRRWCVHANTQPSSTLVIKWANAVDRHWHCLDSAGSNVCVCVCLHLTQSLFIRWCATLNLVVCCCCNVGKQVMHCYTCRSTLKEMLWYRMKTSKRRFSKKKSFPLMRLHCF